jgi:hypothetical protein
MKFPSKEEVAAVREAYPVGSVVEIVSMSDPYRDMPRGTRGVVTRVDDTGTVFAKWANKSSLGAVYGEDTIRKVTRKSDIIKTQARLVANSGRTNMFDKKAAFEIAVELDYHEFADFIFSHSDSYGNFILTGKLPAEIDTEEVL